MANEIEIPQRLGNGPARVNRRIIPSANDLLGFDSNKKLVNISPDAILALQTGVHHASVAFTAAQLIAMYAAPRLLVAAPGAGHTLMIARASFKITRTSTAFTGGGAAIIQYGATVNGGGTQAADSTIASTVITGAAGTTHTWRSGLTNLSDNSALDNVGLYLSNATAAFAAGTGTAVVDIWYYVN